MAEPGRGGAAHCGVPPDARASRSARSRRTRARASSRWAWNRAGSQIWNLWPWPTNTASPSRPSVDLRRSSRKTRPSEFGAQDLAHAEKRGREGVASRRIGRHRLQQGVDLGDERVAAAVERRRVERRIGVDAGEAILRQHLAERRGNRDSPLGVEAMDEMGEKSIHRAALQRAKGPAPGAFQRSATAPTRGQLTGWRGIAWDPMGVNESEGIWPAKPPSPAIRGC